MGLFSAFLIWPGVPLLFVIMLLWKVISGTPAGKSSGSGGSAGLAIIGILGSSILTWSTIISVSVTYDNWWILGGGVGVALLVQAIFSNALD